MPTEAFDATDPLRRNMFKNSDWALCVGAGICNGIMPDWATITRQMLVRARSTPISPDEVQLLPQELGWSLDSVLQYALNEYELSGRTLNEFNSDLAQELYGGILATAASRGLRDALVALLSNPFLRNPNDVLELESFFSTVYGASSVMQLARCLLRAKLASCAPTSVLTFNADVVLHSVLTLLQIRESHLHSGSLSPSFDYRAIYRSTDQPNGKIPIYHIHGSITPALGNREAREKLVFPESSYSQLAASVYAWPQTVFLATAQASRIVFVGLSMSDPNIRRWLSWCEGYRRADIAQRGVSPTFLSQHLWITTPSTDPNIQHAKESGLLHLGIRTAFIPNWSAKEEGLGNILGI